MFKKFYMGSGVGHGQYLLTSFDDALLQARVGNYNLVRVSSILPSGMIRQESIDIKEGSQLNIAYARISSSNPSETISAAVSVGIPVDRSKIGVIMECALVGVKEESIKNAEEMVKEAMVNRGYDIEQIITCSCEATPNSRGYTTVFAGLAMW